jgi:endoglucanase
MVDLADLPRIAAAGFDGVRLPVRWDVHTGPAPGFAIAPAHMQRVAEIVDAALQANLKLILDVHHFGPLYENPRAQRAHFVAIWRQIAARFAGYPDGLIFEPLNEPRGDAMTPAVVTDLNAAALAVIRPAHPTRLVVLGGPNWNSIYGLARLSVPNDPHIAVTAHYYEPHAFTHHLAAWERPPPRFDHVWGLREDLDQVRKDIAEAASLARARNAPLLLGEFGVNENVAIDQRAAWTRAVREAAEANGAGWCHWDFKAAFPVFDEARGAWIEEMRAALLE